MMNKLHWIFFTATRYISGRKRNKSSPSSLLAVMGITTGVLALIVILAVMNGFQLVFIEDILELSSYHLRIELPLAQTASLELLEEMRSLPQVSAAVPFQEFQALAGGRKRNRQACLVRALPPDALELDPGMAGHLEFERGSFALTLDNGIILGAELGRKLGVTLGDEISLFSITGQALEDMFVDDSIFIVQGLFRSYYDEYDSGWAFISLEAAEKLHEQSHAIGIKLHDRWQDQDALGIVAALEGLETARIRSWRDFNRAFFNALRTEKVLMFFLVALIFIVVALNIYQAQRRSILERREEIGLLRAIGATEGAVRLIFTLDGLIIGFVGASLGVVLGLLVSYNIAAFFTILEYLVNTLLELLNYLAFLIGQGSDLGVERFAIFSPAVFYIKEIPSRVIPGEVCIIYFFGFLSAGLAAWLASGRVTRIRSAEVLRYE